MIQERICRLYEEGKEKTGSHFMLEFQRPIKYKVSKRLCKNIYTCTYCLKHFRSPGLLRRHKESVPHRVMEKKRIKITWKNGEKTYQRKLYQTRKRAKMQEKKDLIAAAAICNEFSYTSDKFPHSHCHMYVKSGEPMFFHDMKKPCGKTLMSTAETQSGLPFVLHLRQKSNLFVFSFFLVYNNL